MLDPLRSRPSPFEVLGVDRHATATEINAALAARLGRGGNPQELVAAKQTLRDPVERTLAAAFDYWPEDFGALTPSPFDDPAVLGTERRAETARRWEAHLSAAFPDLAAVHALAVLWYWWAEHLSANGTAGPEPGSPSRAEAWEMAVGYWCALANADAFWETAWPEDGAVTGRARERIPADLRGRLVRARSLVPEGDGDDAARLDRLETTVATETAAGRAIATRVRTPRGRVTCGPLLLGHLGLLEVVGRLVDSELDKHPDDGALLALRTALSPLSEVTALLDAEQPRRALAALANLHPAPDTLEDRDRWRLRSHAYALLARQEQSVGHHEESLEAWREAFMTVPNAESDALRDEFVTSWQQTVNATPAAQRDQAVTLLERVLQVVDDERLRQVLADRVLARAFDMFTAAQERVQEKGPTPHAVSALQKALHEVERAAELGSERAAEQVSAARQVVAVVLANRGVETINRAQEAMAENGPTDAAVAKIRSGLKDLDRAADLGSEHAAEQARQARDLLTHIPPPAAVAAAKRHDWSAAVVVLEKAVKNAGPNPPAALTGFLADMLTARGVETINHAQEGLARDVPDLTALTTVVSGLEDLDRAAGLGSTRAKEQAAVARRLLEALGRGGIHTPGHPTPQRPGQGGGRAKTPKTRKPPTRSTRPKARRPRRRVDLAGILAGVVVTVVVLGIWVLIGWGLGALSNLVIGAPWWGYGLAALLLLGFVVAAARGPRAGRR